jgi:membrane dipeptidase
MTTTEIGRRFFLGMTGAAALVGPALAQRRARPPRRPTLIVNALGGLDDPNVQGETGERTISDRIIADARASGLTAVNVTMGYVSGNGEPFEQTVREIARWDARLAGRPDDLIKVLSAADIVRASRENRIGIIFGFQNAAMMGRDASRVDAFADLGVRVIQLTYNPANSLGGGSMAPGDPGLTDFGREVIDRLNRNKLMVDLSHSGRQTCLDAARASRQPISINHTGCRALVDLPRNKSDEELRLVAEGGGFVGIYFMPFLNPASLATAEDVVAHIDHAVNICGEDHVGIGTDGGTTAIDDMAGYRAHMRAEVAERRAAGIGAAGENPDTLPFVEDLSGPDQYHRLIALLAARGYNEARIEKILGLNFVNFGREVWGA